MFAGGMLGAPHVYELAEVAAGVSDHCEPWGSSGTFIETEKVDARHVQGCAASAAHSTPAFKNLTFPGLQRHTSHGQRRQGQAG